MSTVKLRSDPALSLWLSHLAVEEPEPLVYSYSFTLSVGVEEVGAYVSLTYWVCLDLDPEADPTPAAHWLLRQGDYAEYTDEYPDLELVRFLSVAADQNPDLQVLGATRVTDELAALAEYLGSLHIDVIRAGYEAAAGVEWGAERARRKPLSLEDLQAITADLAKAYANVANQANLV